MRLLREAIGIWLQARRYRLAVDQLRMESERLRYTKERELARYVSSLADYIEGRKQR